MLDKISVMKLADYLERESETVARFAARIGKSAEAVRLYKKGLRKPREKTMRAIMDATGGSVTANDFFDIAA